MFYQKYKDLFLNEARGGQQGNMPRQSSSENARNTAFSRNAEMLMGGGNYGSSNTKLRDMNLDQNSFNNPYPSSKPQIKPPLPEYTKPPSYEPVKRAVPSRENQISYGKGGALDGGIQNMAYQESTALNNPILDLNNKAKDSQTSAVMKNAFEWRETTTAEPSRRKAQSRNSNVAAVDSQNDMVFGVIDKREHEDLLVIYDSH